MTDTGASRRQIDYWTGRGWLDAVPGSGGTGRARRWPASEVEVCRRMVRLVDVGIDPGVAAALARGDAPTVSAFFMALVGVAAEVPALVGSDSLASGVVALFGEAVGLAEPEVDG